MRTSNSSFAATPVTTTTIDLTKGCLKTFRHGRELLSSLWSRPQKYATAIFTAIVGEFTDTTDLVGSSTSTTVSPEVGFEEWIEFSDSTPCQEVHQRKDRRSYRQP